MAEQEQSTAIIIPARWASTRFPGKPLALLGGKPVLQHVWEACTATNLPTYIATDHAKIAGAAQAWGASVLQTPESCQNGTERIAACLENPSLHNTQYFINVQGDEPFIQPQLITQLAKHLKETGADVATAVRRIRKAGELAEPALVKAVLGSSGRAHYFSRSAVPYLRDVPPEDWPAQHPYWAHLGIYAYTRAVVQAYPSLPPSPLEQAEKLEQLRLLEAGYTIQTIPTHYAPIGIDTPEDLAHAETLLASR